MQISQYLKKIGNQRISLGMAVAVIVGLIALSVITPQTPELKYLSEVEANLGIPEPDSRYEHDKTSKGGFGKPGVRDSYIRYGYNDRQIVEGFLSELQSKNWMVDAESEYDYGTGPHTVTILSHRSIDACMQLTVHTEDALKQHTIIVRSYADNLCSPPQDYEPIPL